MLPVFALKIDLSDDGGTWRNADSVVSPSKYEGPIRITFDTPETARYIRLKASGKSKLSFDEVEVYGTREH